jgi:death on curing protein
MDVIFLSVETVELFHKRALQEHGGMPGVRSRDLLESAVFQPQQSAFGEDAYSSFASKAAAYGFFIAQNQPFIDGNKRTAAASMLAFLYLNGFALAQSDDDVYEAFIRIGTKEWSQDDFFNWVERSIVADDAEASRDQAH